MAVRKTVTRTTSSGSKKLPAKTGKPTKATKAKKMPGKGVRKVPGKIGRKARY